MIDSTFFGIFLVGVRGIMKRLNRRVFGLLLAPVVFIAALGSESYSISAYADEPTTEQVTIPEEELPLAGEAGEITDKASEEQKPSFAAPENETPADTQPITEGQDDEDEEE